MEESAHPKGVAFQRKFVAHFESDEIDLISSCSGHKTVAFILTRCSVFKDQNLFLSLSPHLSGDFYNISYSPGTLQELFLKSFLPLSINLAKALCFNSKRKTEAKINLS
ncbi:hypothetical protein FHS19_006744 [Paenibacillus rhizosphaerae]|uniref:Uncharacterized protein n=1 Tax=Paenibacillus rhizosphaerae TaxID=297318 RepID=A0A839U2X9_9BACL|nr:hypothetical protein [Paenibacillus rhizosphaerae]